MLFTSTFYLIPLMIAAYLSADENPTWRNKDPKEWNADDAKQILTNSPWAKMTKLANVRDLSVGERRDGGDWQAGGGHGVGLAGTGIFGSEVEAAAIHKAHEKPDPGSIVVRWESARPVRRAELVSHEVDTPTWEGDYYGIAVYEVATPKRWNLANGLKGVSYLRRPGKKDMKPARVMISRQTNGLATILYLFPRSVEITKKDGMVEFGAQIGRLFVTQYFFTPDMMLLGELEL